MTHNKIFKLPENHTLIDIFKQIKIFENNRQEKTYKISINILRNYTIDTIIPHLKYFLYQQNIIPEICIGDYNTVNQDIINDNSFIYTKPADITYISLVINTFDNNINSIKHTQNESSNKLTNLLSTAIKKIKGIIIVNTFIEPLYSNTGIANSENNNKLKIRELNLIIHKFSKQYPKQLFVIDFNRILSITGEKNGIDYRFWYSSKMPFKNNFLSILAYEISKFVFNLKGKTKKCLVLDCDNTLWGGIIGEDGINNIKIGQNNYPDNAYYAFQQEILNLYERGVIIAICSKNNIEDVFEVLDNHPDNLIKRKHISAFQVNWNDKANNIKKIAKDLNIGTDSIVFVDDNPREIEQVYQEIPEVTCILVPENKYEFPQIIKRCGLFDTLNITNEDKIRTQLYKEENLRKNLSTEFSDITEYLKSLEISVIINKDNSEEIARVSQLTQKTNQFNLTTKRYSEIDIKNFMESADSNVFTLQVSDKFGNLGLTGVCIAKLKDNNCYFDTLLLSCRILGRQLEFYFINKCIKLLSSTTNIKSFTAKYTKTIKNKQVSDFWEKTGFTIDKKDLNNTYYKANLNELNIKFVSFIKEN